MADITDSLDNGDEIERIMHKYYPMIIESAFGDASLAGIPVSFELENEYVQTILDRLGKNIRAVAQTTREEIQALVGRQAAEGWSVEELARQIRDRGEIGSVTRSLMTARTETATGYNLGSIAAYRTGNVTHVDVLDSDDDEICAAANGSRWTLDEAEANPIGHPNCTRTFSPVIE